MLLRAKFSAPSVLALLVLAEGCGTSTPAPATSGASNLLQYPWVFPEQSVDHLGLLTLSDLTPPERHKTAFEAVMNGDGAEEVDDLLRFTSNNPDDTWAYLLLVHAADSSSRLREITEELEMRSREAYRQNTPADNLHIASGYSMVMVSGRRTKRTEEGFGLNRERLRALNAPDRISIMMLVSVLWRYDGREVLRTSAAEFLQDDPDFYQLRTFLAHALAHGAGPTHRSDGTVIPGTGYDADPVELQKQIARVLEEHPDYIPAYFVAIAGASEEDAAKHIDKYLSSAEPGTDWYKRAEKYKKGMQRN